MAVWPTLRRRGRWAYYGTRNGITGIVRGAMDQAESVQELDATGLTCPMPLLKAKRALNAMAVGQRLRILATDPGAPRDFQVFCQQSGHELLSSEVQGGTFELLLQKV